MTRVGGSISPRESVSNELELNSLMISSTCLALTAFYLRSKGLWPGKRLVLLGGIKVVSLLCYLESGLLTSTASEELVFVFEFLLL